MEEEKEEEEEEEAARLLLLLLIAITVCLPCHLLAGLAQLSLGSSKSLKLVYRQTDRQRTSTLEWLAGSWRARNQAAGLAVLEKMDIVVYLDHLRTQRNIELVLKNN